MQKIVEKTNKTYHIITYGCQMNKHDSEKIAGMLTSMGYAHSPDPRQGKVIVFNTCSVREHAADRLYGNLNALKPRKKAEPDMIIMVGGCLAQNDREYVLKKAPHVDIVFGTQNMTQIPELLSGHNDKKEAIVAIKDQSDENLLHIESARAEKLRAWLPITIGCDNFCSYCIVPHVRGRERSLSMEQLLEEANKLISDGVIEVTLLGQNVNSYGKDLYGEPRFAGLLEKISELPFERIRFTTSHPKDLDSEVISTMKAENICSHLHLPVQSGSDHVLKNMNRKYTRSDYLDKIKDVREELGDISITTDIIVGYPGETEADFDGTLSLVELCQFDSAYTFLYSPREGTKAYRHEDDVSPETKNKRFEKLLKLQNDITNKRSQRFVGRKLKVLVEGPSKKNESYLSGRTDDNKLVHFMGGPELIDKMVEIKVNSARTWYLRGELC